MLAYCKLVRDVPRVGYLLNEHEDVYACGKNDSNMMHRTARRREAGLPILLSVGGTSDCTVRIMR